MRFFSEIAGIVISAADENNAVGKIKQRFNILLFFN